MPRAPFRRKSGAREANQLVRLAEGLASSKSRAEDVYWERELQSAVTQHLENNDEEAINRALDKAHDAPDALRVVGVAVAEDDRGVRVGPHAPDGAPAGGR